MVVIETRTVSGTVRVGRMIGRCLRPGDVVALAGELGTGKTHLIKGLAEGVGIKRSIYISSPSFTLINEYPGKIPFYHLDLYRLDTETAAEELGVEEYFQGNGVTAIEWADKVPSFLPKNLLWIHLRYLEERTRSIEIEGRGGRYEALAEEIFTRPMNRTEEIK